MRIRLAATFVVFTAILLAGIGFFLRQSLRDEAELNARIAVEADWGAAGGFLHIDNQRPEWVNDRNDFDQAYAVERLRHVYQLTDPDGNVLEQSAIFESIRATRQTRGTPTYDPQYSILHDRNGIPYSTRASWIRDDQNRRYLLAIGRSLAAPYRRADRFVLIYTLLALAMLPLTSVFSWWLTGVAIRQGRRTT